MGRPVGIHPLAQDLDHRPLTCDCELRTFEALITIADLALAGVQISLHTVQPCLQSVQPTDQIQRDRGQVERGVALVNAAHNLVERWGGGHHAAE